MHLPTFKFQEATERYWSKDDWLMPFAEQQNIEVLVITTGEPLVFGGESDMDEEWTAEEMNLVKRWTVTMPQLQGVVISYGYSNREGILISRFDSDIEYMAGHRAYMEREAAEENGGVNGTVIPNLFYNATHLVRHTDQILVASKYICIKHKYYISLFSLRSHGKLR